MISFYFVSSLHLTSALENTRLCRKFQWVAIQLKPPHHYFQNSDISVSENHTIHVSQTNFYKSKKIDIKGVTKFF